MINIKQLEMMYFSNDESVPYGLKNSLNGKNVILNIKPILVKDWSLFGGCLDLFEYQQQDYNDINILSMNYLDFVINILLKQVNEQNINVYETKLAMIFNYSCNISDIRLGTFKKKNCLVIFEDNKEVAIITAKEFDEIRKIILYQNRYDYDDRYVNPDVKRLYETYARSKNKNVENPTLEKQKIFVISKTGISMKDINNMTYRTFSQIYRTNVQVDLYFANKMLQANERIKDDVVYPLYEKEKDKYAELFVGMNKLSELGISGTEQLQNIQ